LSKVNSFADIFRKLSSFHASIRLYWSVRRCHAVATLALGSRPRQRELQGCGPKRMPRN
jgi:hypothetical protein